MAVNTVSEEELTQMVHDINCEANHHRSLRGSYGYNDILDVDLFISCMEAYATRQSDKVRVLDIGPGDGFALSQLEKELACTGMESDFECSHSTGVFTSGLHTSSIRQLKVCSSASF